ncbi:MAG: glycosyltransferase, partial [Halioglobus sp.]
MRILHVLDHSIPLQSGYTFRTRNILRYQRRLGWETFHVTGLKQGTSEAGFEEVDGLGFYRTPEGSRMVARLPAVNQWQVVTTLAKRIDQVVEEVRPDVLHAHSPALNGLAAARVAKRRGL